MSQMSGMGWRISTLTPELESRPMQTNREPTALGNYFFGGLSCFRTEVTEGSGRRISYP